MEIKPFAAKFNTEHQSSDVVSSSRAPTKLKKLLINYQIIKHPIQAQSITNSLKIYLIQFIHIINAVLKLQYFPKQWKEAAVTSIPNIGTTVDDLNNYRPINLLLTLGKIMEKVLLNHINATLNKNKINNENQFGFKPGNTVLRLPGSLTI